MGAVSDRQEIKEILYTSNDLNYSDRNLSSVEMNAPDARPEISGFVKNNKTLQIGCLINIKIMRISNLLKKHETGIIYVLRHDKTGGVQIWKSEFSAIFSP